MICTEKGTISDTQYFFINPSEIFVRNYYYMLVCGHFYCRDGYSIQREGGVVPIVIYIVEGELQLTYENKSYTASRGEIILIDCNKPHKYYCNSTCEYLFFHFDGCNSHQLIDHLIIQNGGAVFRLESGRKIYEIMNSIIAKLYFDQFPTDIECSCAVYDTLCSMQSFNEILPVSSSPISNAMSDIITYIKNNIGEALTLDTLANKVNLSKFYFSHLFKEETGLSPMEFVLKTRMNLAKVILKTTRGTISEIAINLGYSSSASFINAFTAKVGISPNKFRNTVNPHEKDPII